MADYRTYADQELLALLKAGDERAFTEIYRRYWPPLIRHAQRMLADKEECRDILQEVFTAFWTKASSLADDSNLSAYLYKMVRNQVLDAASRNKKTELLDELGDYLDTNTPPTDAKLHEKELLTLIDQELEHMPTKMKKVYELSRKDQLSHQEIADEMHITVYTVKSQLNNAIRKIKVRLGFK